MKKMNIALYSVVLVIAIFYIYESLSFGLWQEFGPGPGLFPLVLGFCFLILGIIQLFSDEVLKRNTHDIFLAKEEKLRIISLTTVSFLTVIFMNIMGFLLATILFIFIILKCLECYTFKQSIFTSVVLSSSLYILFNNVFKLDLPTGLLTLFL